MIILDGVPVANPQRNQRFIIYTTSEQGVEQVWVAIVVRTNKHTTITKSSVTISLQEVDSWFKPKKRTQPREAIFTNSFPLEEEKTLHCYTNVPGGRVILGTITKVSSACPLTAPGL